MARPRTTDPRSTQLKARFTDAELDTVNRHAAASGLTVSELLRFGVLRQSPPPTRRAGPGVEDTKHLALLLASVGKIGSNVNQLAKLANQGLWPEARELHEAAADVQWMRRTLMHALGVRDEPQHPPPPSPSTHAP